MKTFKKFYELSEAKFIYADTEEILKRDGFWDTFVDYKKKLKSTHTIVGELDKNDKIVSLELMPKADYEKMARADKNWEDAMVRLYESSLDEGKDTKLTTMEKKLEKLLQQYAVNYKVEEKMTGNKTFKFGLYKVSVGGVFAYEYTLFKGEKEIEAQISLDGIEKILEKEFIPDGISESYDQFKDLAKNPYGVGAELGYVTDDGKSVEFAAASAVKRDQVAKELIKKGIKASDIYKRKGSSAESYPFKVGFDL